MITDIFIPKKIGSYQLFPQRIVGFDIGKTHVHATVSYVRGNTTTIERALHEKIENGNPAEHGARVSKAIAAILDKVGSYHEIRTALPSSLAVFKELKLPFTSMQKIKMVINYEVEPLLPFSIHDAVVDFIITKQIKEEASSELLVAAVQKQHIAQHLLLFENAGVQPDIITIDFFALYDAFKLIPNYAHLHDGVALIDFGHSSTRIAYISNQQLRFIRTLPKGVLHVAQTLSKELNIELNESLESIIRFGLQTNNPQHAELLTQALTGIWQEVLFTLQSFAAQSHNDTISEVLLLGGGAHIKVLPEFVTKLLGVKCALFDPMLLTENPEIKITTGLELSTAQSISVAASLPSATDTPFNLKSIEFGAQSDDDSLKYIITTIALVALIIGSLGVHTFMQTRKLSNELYESKKDAINLLRENFKKVAEEVSAEAAEAQTFDLEEAVDVARVEVKEEKQLWFSFSGQARSSFLLYLLELSKIDREALGFEPQKITFSRKEGEDVISIDGKVRDHEALRKLEKHLDSSKIFSRVEKQENTEFSNWKITISQTHKGAA